MSLKKIAEMTGVSVSTVSRVLNKKDYNCASQAVKKKIWEAARELHYVPNENARNLKMGGGNAQRQKRRLAIVLARVESLTSDPFFEELFRSVEQEVFARGCVTGPVLTAEEAFKKNPQADGLILLGRCRERTLLNIKEKNKNIVAIDRNPTPFFIDEVICDGKEAAAKAMDYLIKKGYRKIGYIGDCSYENRYVGYCDSLIKNGIPMNYSYICPTTQTEEEGIRAMNRLMEQTDLEAVFCANDITAIGAMRAYKGNKSKSRRKIGIISIDDIRAAGDTELLLTTVHIPQEDMGKMAVKILLDRIEKGHAEMLRVEFQGRLVRRESC